MIWKLPYHNLFIIYFSVWQVCLFDIVYGFKGKTAECPEWDGTYVFFFFFFFFFFFARANSCITHVTWWYAFLPGQKSSITHVTNYHTFCAPQEWYVLESHVSITYAKWTCFLVNVWYKFNKCLEYKNNEAVHEEPITKTRLFKCIENFTTKNGKISR